MGSKSKSKTSSATTIDNSQSVIDNTGSVGATNVGDIGALTASGENSSVSVALTQTDHGAVSGAFDFARDIGGEAFNFGGQAFQFADSQAKRSADASLQALDQVRGLTETMQSGGSQKTIIWITVGAVAAVTIVAVAVTMGSKK